MMKHNRSKIAPETMARPMAVRMKLSTLEEVRTACIELGGMSINSFCVSAIESALAMIRQPRGSLTPTKFIAAAQFTLTFDKAK